MTFNKIKSYIVNPLDMCILIIVMAILMSGFFNLNNKKLFLLFNPAENAVITITLQTPENTTADDFSQGQKVYSAETDDLIGYIKSAKNVKEKKYSAINNTLFYDYTDSNVGVIIEIDAKIKTFENRNFIGNSFFVSAGTPLDIYFDDVGAFSGEIDEIIIK